jgi:uncharacterized protein
MFSTFLGVGGGLIMVPFMVVALDESQHVAEGTSLVIVVFIGIAGVLAHRKDDLVSFRHAAWLSAGGVFGAAGGSLLALRIPSEQLETVFAVFLVGMGVYLVRDGYRMLRPHRVD